MNLSLAWIDVHVKWWGEEAGFVVVVCLLLNAYLHNQGCIDVSTRQLGAIGTLQHGSSQAANAMQPGSHERFLAQVGALGDVDGGQVLLLGATVHALHTRKDWAQCLD